MHVTTAAPSAVVRTSRPTPRRLERGSTTSKLIHEKESSEHEGCSRARARSAKTASQPMLIVAKDVGREASPTWGSTTARHAAVCAVKAPGSAIARKEMCGPRGCWTGGKAVPRTSASSCENWTIWRTGQAQAGITATGTNHVVDGEGKEARIEGPGKTTARRSRRPTS